MLGVKTSVLMGTRSKQGRGGRRIYCRVIDEKRTEWKERDF
jgi:hypothetical protein